MKDAKKVLDRFDSWLDKNFDMTILKLQSKQEHVHSVYNLSASLAQKSNFDDEDIFIIEVISALHDVGRFVQYQDTGKFLDTEVFNHSIKGAEMLKDGLLKQMLPETRVYDGIIVTAIYYHGLKDLPDNVDDRTLKFCKLIRDVDRCDLYERICNRFLEIYMSFDFGEKTLTPEIKKKFINQESMLIKELNSKLDLLALQLGLLCQYESIDALKLIEGKKYISRIINHFNSIEFYDSNELEWMRLLAESFLTQRMNMLENS